MTGKLRRGVLAAEDADEVGATEVVAMLDAVARIHELLRENLHHVFRVATFEAAQKIKVKHFGVVVLEDHVFDVDALEFLLVLRALLDVAMKLAIFGDRMAPEFATTARFLADFELDSLLLFVFGQLHFA